MPTCACVIVAVSSAATAVKVLYLLISAPYALKKSPAKLLVRTIYLVIDAFSISGALNINRRRFSCRGARRFPSHERLGLFFLAETTILFSGTSRVRDAAIFSRRRKVGHSMWLGAEQAAACRRPSRIAVIFRIVASSSSALATSSDRSIRGRPFGVNIVAISSSEKPAARPNITDLWSIARQYLLGVAMPNYALVGRWIASMAYGRFRHDSMAAVPHICGEHAIGWTVHYLIGVAFAALFIVLIGTDWFERPRLVPALLFGVVTVMAPFMLMQPAMWASAGQPHTASRHSQTS